MKPSWIMGIVIIFMVTSFFVHGVIEQSASPISQDIMNDLATLAQPEVQMNPLTTLLTGVGAVLKVFFQMLLDLFMPSLYTGTFIYVWLFLVIAIPVGIIAHIVISRLGGN